MTPAALPPLSLYVHIPWCVRKCPYCDFNSHAKPDGLPEQDYIQALSQDLSAELERLQTPRPLHSIFIGGGTPSLFSAEAIGQILAEVDRQWGIGANTEVTLEANPGTFEQQRFEGFRHAGVNRLSLGIQSFNDTHLQSLGRIHNADNALTAARSARRIFDRLNLDLMHGLPGQLTAEALADLQQAIDLSPDHLSWYQLTLEPNTEFHARPPTLPVDEALWDIQEQGQELLDQAGFRQYEISAYARNERFSQHNLNYWQFGDYLGIGAGAHGKTSQQAGNSALEFERHHKLRQPKAYLASLNKTAGREHIPTDELSFEFMLNALRLSDGVASELFSARTGLPLALITPQLSKAREVGLLERDTHILRPTQQGRLFLNDLLGLFL
ncbi:radical SAM family heme chaperone HemW [Nitrincola sp.]|uniref:radical SAM family heme chaperone HemW n=1 Tax=Nitrincola sp. TaxID=1926584 RepID=UPI003A9129C7